MSAAPQVSITEVVESTGVTFHPLSVRKDGESWIIGRKDTGVFIAVPTAAHQAIALLSKGCTVGETAQALRSETGASLDVSQFVATLDDLEFVASIDDELRPESVAPRPSFAWLRPEHVRWLLHPGLPWLVSLIIAAAAVMLAIRPALVPGYQDLVWNRHSGIVLAVNAAVGWAVMGLHELGHLATARAADVPARITLGTRLQFIAVQTDVSGVWAALRRHRMTVYLAGIAVNLLITSLCVLIEGLTSPSGLIHQLIALTAMESLLFLPLQFSLFMRTDMYFVVQDLTRCANLYADGTAHLRYLADRLMWSMRRSGHRPVDATQQLRGQERRTVRLYSWLLLFGTIACISIAVLITVRVTAVLFMHGVGELAGRSVVNVVDGAAGLTAISFFWVLWLFTWWRRHRSQVTLWIGDTERFNVWREVTGRWVRSRWAWKRKCPRLSRSGCSTGSRPLDRPASQAEPAYAAAGPRANEWGPAAANHTPAAQHYGSGG